MCSSKNLTKSPVVFGSSCLNLTKSISEALTIVVIHLGISATINANVPMSMDLLCGFHLNKSSGILSRHLRVAATSASSSFKYSWPHVVSFIIFLLLILNPCERALPNFIDFTRAREIHIRVPFHLCHGFFHFRGWIHVGFPAVLISREVFKLRDHNDSVILAGHVRHDIDQFFIADHRLFKQFGQLASIARFANKYIVNNNHKMFRLITGYIITASNNLGKCKYTQINSRTELGK